MYILLNTLSEYTYFYISKNITLYTFLLVFKIVENLQSILKASHYKWEMQCYVLHSYRNPHLTEEISACFNLEKKKSFYINTSIEFFRYELEIRE